MSFKKDINSLQKLSKLLKSIEFPGKTSTDYQLLIAVTKAQTTLNEIDLKEIDNNLTLHEKNIKKSIDSAINDRRENLLNAARDQNFGHKRLTHYDRIGPIKITYKAQKVKFELGSELLTEFDEADGKKIFENIRVELKKLDDYPFDRKLFFKAIKDSIQLAKLHEKVTQDGWVPIHTVYAYLVLLRHLYLEDFAKKPEKNKFSQYLKVQFVYDLARFGLQGWRVGNESLRSRTPNMATVAAGNSVTLPDLKSIDGLGEKIAVLRIDKQG